MLKKIKTLTEQQTSIVHSEKTQKKVIYLYYNMYTNIDKVEMLHVLHNKVALLKRGDVLSGKQEIVTKEFLERLDTNTSVYN